MPYSWATATRVAAEDLDEVVEAADAELPVADMEEVDAAMLLELVVVDALSASAVSLPQTVKRQFACACAEFVLAATQLAT